jgi:HemK-related putative methylase
MVYAPAEDSWLLEKTITVFLKRIRNKKRIKILDMGSGSGIQAQACIDAGADRTQILCGDIDENAIRILKSHGLNSIKTDLFSNIKNQTKFDLIIFNAPYLPEDKREDKQTKLATTAGEEGYELILKFLDQAKSHLNKKGSIILLFSSLSKPAIILNYAKKIKYTYKKLAESSLFFERLFIYEFKQ